MAVFAFTDGVFTLNSVDLSDHVRSVVLELTAVELDATSITDTYDVTIIGRRSGSLKIDFLDDLASAKTDATISAAYAAGVAVPFTLKLTSGDVSATNPEWQGNLIPSSAPVGGAQGELLMKSVTWKTSGPVVRDTSA